MRYLPHKVPHWHNCKPQREKAMGLLLLLLFPRSFFPGDTVMSFCNCHLLLGEREWPRWVVSPGVPASLDLHLIAPRKAAPLSWNLPGSFIICHWFLSGNQRPKLSRDTYPLTFLRDYGFNSIVQEYPFFMLISLLFKENGPENSVILYDDPTAIGRRGQPCHLTALKKQTENSRKCEGVCSFSISRDCFISMAPSTNPRRSSYHLPGSQQRVMWLAPPVTLPWKGHFDSSSCSYLSWEIKCVFQRVFIRLMKVFRRLFCCCLIWFMTELSGVRFLFGLCFCMVMGGQGSFFFFFNGIPTIFKTHPFTEETKA